MSSRPFCLPREITCIIFISVYLPNGYHNDSVKQIYDIVSSFEQQKPEAALILLGDTNAVAFSLRRYKQYITCNTRKKQAFITLLL